MNSTTRTYIGLGSNLEHPEAQVQRALTALAALPLCQLVACSSLYATPPVGPQDQPDFINAVACLDTRLSPLALLDQLQALEQRHRRRRLRHWGPRTLDLDLLLYGERVIQQPRLSVPHPHMHTRAFVIVPLDELTRIVNPTLSLHQQPLNHWLTGLDVKDIRRLGEGPVPPSATV